MAGWLLGIVMLVKLRDFERNGGSTDLVRLAWMAWLLGLDGLPCEMRDFEGNQVPRSAAAA